MTSEDIHILDVNYETKSCYIQCGNRHYGCQMKNSNGDWYFSFDDRDTWHKLNDYMK